MAQLTPEQQAVRERVSDLRWEAMQLKQRLEIDAPRLSALSIARRRARIKSLMDEAARLRATLPARIDPWGNVTEE